MADRSVARKTRPAAEDNGRRLKVLHVINGLARGGAETVLYRLISNSPSIDHEVICLVGRGWYSDKLEAHGIRVHHLNWTSAPSGLAAMWRLESLIRKSDADLVQAWMYRSNVLAGLASRIAGKTVLWNVRCSSLGPLRLASRFAARVGGLLAGSCADIVVNCSEASAKLHGHLGYDRAPGIIIANGYDSDELHPDEVARRKSREARGIQPDDFIIGCIARWHAQKGFPVLFEALALLKARGVPFRLLLTGKGLDPENTELASLIEGSGCADQVRLTGETADVAGIARTLDLHVLASIGSEGFPNTVAETMLVGTPNVATYVGDAALIIGNTGWVVEPNDAEKLADAIQNAYHERKRSPARWEARRHESRKRVAEEFPVARMAASYERLWRRVADARSSSASPLLPGSRRLRILHIITGLGPGGAEAVLYRLVTRSKAFEHEVVCLERRDWYSAKFEERGIRVHHVNWTNPWLIVPALMRLYGIIRKSDADLVQTWMYRSNLLGGLIARWLRKPVIWNIRSTSPSARFGSPTIAKLGGKLSSRIPEAVINCSACSAKFHEGLGYRPGSSQIIANGFDPQIFTGNEDARRDSRQKVGIDDDTFLVGAIDRWDQLKDIPGLVKAIAILHDRRVPIRAVLVGRGLAPDNRRLTRLISDNSCQDVIDLLGERPDIPDIARALDLHVLASNSEGFPNAVAETMLSRTPNVVTDVGDAALIVGDTAWVVEPRNPEALATAIESAYREWKSSPAAWSSRRSSAERRILDNFSLDHMTSLYEDLWNGVARRSLGRRHLAEQLV